MLLIILYLKKIILIYEIFMISITDPGMILNQVPCLSISSFIKLGQYCQYDQKNSHTCITE